MTDRTLSVRVSEELHRALSDVAHEHRADVADIVRPWLRDLALDAERQHVPDHLLDQLEREQLMEANAPKWDRIHFPSRVSYQFKQAFENGDLSVDALGDRAVEEMREIYREEAVRAYDDEELQQAAVEFVESVADHAAEAADASEFDALDPEEMFANYAGVEDGREREEQSDVRERARSLIQQSVDSRKVVSILTSEFGLSNTNATEIYNSVETEMEDDR